jgi:hypothetical protein
MAKSPKIIVKYASPTFTLRDIVGAVGHQETIDRASKHLDADRLYDWPDTCRILQELNSKIPALGSVDNVNLLNVLSCVAPPYEVFSDAIYIGGFHTPGKRLPHPDHSILLNQYMSNSFELEYSVKNRVLQYLVGVWAARSYIQFVNRLCHLDNIVIMLYGNRCFTICLYANVSDEDMARMESNIKESTLQTLQTADAEAFLSWAFPTIPKKKLGWDGDSWPLKLGGE